MKTITTATLQKMKNEQQKIVAITAYDASFAKLFDEQGVDIQLIGDSLGMVLQGGDDTCGVTVDDIAYHVSCVKAGNQRSFIVADMPFMSYSDEYSAYENAATLMAAGAKMVKLEGGAWLTETIRGLTQRGVPVCAHLGLTPQSVHVFGGFKVQGRLPEQVETMLADALALEAAGAQLLVLECVPSAVGKLISEALTIPTIGIGAGADTDGQILVMHDMLGVSANYMPKFSKNFLAQTGDIRAAVQAYIDEVRTGCFPSAEHRFD